MIGKCLLSSRSSGSIVGPVSACACLRVCFGDFGHLRRASTVLGSRIFLLSKSLLLNLCSEYFRVDAWYI